MPKSSNQLNFYNNEWAARKKAWIIDPNVSRQVEDLGECKEACNNCTFFSWNLETKECRIAYDDTVEVCEKRDNQCGPKNGEFVKNKTCVLGSTSVDLLMGQSWTFESQICIMSYLL